jgi:ribosomal protein S18 acetylase RimI-like enzyme
MTAAPAAPPAAASTAAPRPRARPVQLAVQVRLLPVAALRTRVEQIGNVAATVFAARPWCEPPAASRQLVDRLLLDSTARGFRCVTAEIGGTVVGFAWCRTGWSLANLGGQPVRGPTPVEVRELAVDPRWRGHRIGVALHDLLLTGTSTTAWLTTHPDAHPALALYRSRGWQAVRLVTPPQVVFTRLVMQRRP